MASEILNPLPRSIEKEDRPRSNTYSHSPPDSRRSFVSKKPLKERIVNRIRSRISFEGRPCSPAPQCQSVLILFVPDQSLCNEVSVQMNKFCQEQDGEKRFVDKVVVYSHSNMDVVNEALRKVGHSSSAMAAMCVYTLGDKREHKREVDKALGEQPGIIKYYTFTL